MTHIIGRGSGGRSRARFFRGSLVPGLLGLGLASCATPDASPPPAELFSVRDSAGIEIVTNGEAPVAVFDVGPPLLDMGSVDGPAEMLFASVSAVVLFEDGRVGVADRSARLRFYEPDGRYFGSYGRAGDGPGEFQRIGGAWQRDDGVLVVFDGQAWRVTLVEDGATLSTYPIRPPGLNPPRSVSMLEDGTIVVAERLFDMPESGFEPLTTIVRRIALDTVAPDTVVSLVGGRFGPIVLDGGGRMAGSPLFEPPAIAGAAADRVVTSECRGPEFRDLAPDGSLRRIVRWTAGDRAVAEADVEAHRADRIDALADEDVQRIQAAVFDALRPLRDTIPACAGLRVVDRRATWVEDYARRPSDQPSWRVFVDSRLVGRLRLPAGATLMAVRGDRLATVERDEVDIEHVRIYALPEGLIPE